MTDKLEALSHPVAVVVNKYGDPEAFGERELKLLADLQKVPYNTNFYSQEYVTALLAALEEKGQEVNQLKSDYQKLAQEHRFLANESARKGVRNAELEQRLQQPIKLPAGFRIVPIKATREQLAAVQVAGKSVVYTDMVLAAPEYPGFTVEGE